MCLQTPTQYTDQIGRSVSVPEQPKKIISLVPSISELLWDLGLEERMVGITKFCIHPNKMYRTIERVGGTKKIHHNRIDDLNPDLIIANKEENTRPMVEKLEKKYPVWVSDVNDFPSAMKMIENLGTICGVEENATELIRKIKAKRSKWKEKASSGKKPRVIYLIWRDPWMVVAGDTFVHEMLNEAGYTNAFKDSSRYPKCSMEDMKQLNPDYLFLSSEPYPFKEKHIAELTGVLPEAKIVLVDGELFSWYGSRLLRSYDYFDNLRSRIAF